MKSTRSPTSRLPGNVYRLLLCDKTFSLQMEISYALFDFSQLEPPPVRNPEFSCSDDATVGTPTPALY
jgi:hypothetical protein